MQFEVRLFESDFRAVDCLARLQFERLASISSNLKEQGGSMNTKKLLGSVPTDLLFQALETEKGGVQVYTAALRCALNPDLREEWNKYLEQTKTHVQICTDLIRELGLDPNTETPGRQVVRYLGTSLVKTIELALRCADPQAAQIVAAECVTLAETKDHLKWELIGQLATKSELPDASLLQPAYEQVEEEEDEHLYHTTGWTRELWIQALGMPAVLPPPEEVRDVKTQEEAAQAKKARTKKAAGAR